MVARRRRETMVKLKIIKVKDLTIYSNSETAKQSSAMLF